MANSEFHHRIEGILSQGAIPSPLLARAYLTKKLGVGLDTCRKLFLNEFRYELATPLPKGYAMQLIDGSSAPVRIYISSPGLISQKPLAQQAEIVSQLNSSISTFPASSVRLQIDEEDGVYFIVNPEKFSQGKLYDAAQLLIHTKDLEVYQGDHIRDMVSFTKEVASLLKLNMDKLEPMEMVASEDYNRNANGVTVNFKAQGNSSGAEGALQYCIDSSDIPKGSMNIVRAGQYIQLHVNTKLLGNDVLEDITARCHRQEHQIREKLTETQAMALKLSLKYPELRANNGGIGRG